MYTNTDIHMLMYKQSHKCKCVIVMLRALRQSVHTDVGESQTQWATTGRIRIIGARFLVSRGIWRHPRILRQTQSSKARTNGQMGSRYLAGENGKQRVFSSISSWMQWQWQWPLELCQRWQPQTSATGNVISWNLGPLGIHAAQPYIAQAMRKKAVIVMLQEIQMQV